MGLIDRLNQEIEEEQTQTELKPIKDKMREITIAKRIVRNLKAQLKKMIDDVKETEDDTNELFAELGIGSSEDDD